MNNRKKIKLARVMVLHALASALLILGLFVVAAGSSSGVFAHAIIKQGSFDAAQFKPNTPERIVLHFNSAIHADFVKIDLLDPAGKITPLKTSPGTSADQLIVDFPPMPAGAYALRYRVFAADGHYTDYSLRFQVREPR